ncbi:MAG: hypothetical protein IKH26_11620 [Bacteroidaceae bacterium]|nr:hypothetical protein [Bacteroidaceae bacterium]
MSDHVVEYENYFKETFGDFDPTHSWSMATAVTAHIDLSNAPEGTYEVKIYSEKDGYLLKKAIVQNSAQLHFDAIKGENSVRVLARSTSNLALTAINGYFPVENGVVDANPGTAQQVNTRAGSSVYKSGTPKTAIQYEYVPERLENEQYHTPYTDYPYLTLPNDGKYYIRLLPDQDYSEGANGKYSVTKDGITYLMDMYEIYSVIKTGNFLLYQLGTYLYDSRSTDPAWHDEWNDLPDTEYHYNQWDPESSYYRRTENVIYLAWTEWFHPAYYKAPSNYVERYMSWVVACEDLGGSYDYDFNDIVFDFGMVDIIPTGDDPSTAPEEKSELYLSPLAAGGTRPAYIYYDKDDDGISNEDLVGEIHDLLRGAPTNVPVNVGGSWDVDPTMITRIKLADVDLSQSGTSGTTTAYIDREIEKIRIFVDNDPGKGADVVWAPKKDGSNIPQMLLLPRGWDWPMEMVPIFVVYPLFKDWTTDKTKNGWITTPQSNYYQNPLK